jgi:ABC-type multidrug transport system fused ATPase/permease subunit
MLGKLTAGRAAGIPERAKARLLALTFKLVVARHRLGVIDEAMQVKVVKARAEFARRFANQNVVEFFDPNRFSSSLSLQENILFGRTVLEHANAPARINALVREVASEVGMDAALIRAGLDFEVGNAGSRLSYSERQRLAIARGLMKNPNLLVFNEPTSGLDPATEDRVVRAVLKWAEGRTVLWALGRAELASEFDRVIVLEDGHVVDDGRYEELVAQEGNGLARLVA